MKNAGHCIKTAHSVTARFTAAFRFLTFLFFAVLMTLKVQAEEACPIEPSAFLTLPQDADGNFQARAANRRLLEVYRRYYCLDRRTYYLQAAYVLKLNGTEKIRDSIGKYQHDHNLPPSLSRAGGDDRRIKEFNDLFAQYRRVMPYGGSNVSLQSYEVILVSGFMNEGSDSYFQDMVLSLKKDFKMPEEQIHIVSSESLAGPDKTIEKIKKQYEEIKARNPTAKILMVGHSRGGLILLNAMAKNPQIVMDKQVERIVTMQSPLKGTPAAGAAQWGLDMVKSSLEAFEKINSDCQTCKNTEEMAAGADSMNPEKTHAVFKELHNQLTNEEFAQLSKKVFYISSRASSRIDRVGGFFDDKVNDGTVPSSSHSIRSFGRRLADLPNIAHSDLVVAEPLSDLTARERRAFARTLFEELRNPTIDIEDGMNY